MGSTLAVFKTIVVPAIIAFLAYVLLTFVAVPLWQFYRNRYSHYLPLGSVSGQASSLRQRAQNAVSRLLVASTLRQRMREGINIRRAFRRSASEDSNFLGDDDDGADTAASNRRRGGHGEQGEELGVMVNAPNSSSGAHGSTGYNTNRLSRDLEQGFMDDSDEEDGPTR